MPRRRASVPPISAPRARGIATSAYEKHVTGGAFGTPGSGRRIRQFPVEPPATFSPPQGVSARGDRPRPVSQQPYPTQQEIIARYRQRDLEERRARTGRGILAAQQGDDSVLMPIDMEAKSSNPLRPRAIAAGYDAQAETVRIRFRPPNWPRGEPDGAVYEYYGVPRNVWLNMLRAASPGRYIDRVLDTYPYTRVDDRFEPTGFFSTRQDTQ